MTSTRIIDRCFTYWRRQVVITWETITKIIQPRLSFKPALRLFCVILAKKAVLSIFRLENYQQLSRDEVSVYILITAPWRLYDLQWVEQLNLRLIVNTILPISSACSAMVWAEEKNTQLKLIPMFLSCHQFSLFPLFCLQMTHSSKRKL